LNEFATICLLAGFLVENPCRSVRMNMPTRGGRSPKDGRTSCVVLVVRISTIHQDKRSLDDQIAKCKQFVESEYAGPFKYEILQSRGSGEHLDRKELEALKDFIESGTIDLVVAEDLGRICRRNRAMDFCELCQDHDTRLIAINDRVDTTEEGWEDSAAMATWHHSRSNRDTSNRIKRSLNNRFDQGQLMEGLPFGYIRPEGATSDTQVTKDPNAEPIFKEMFRRLENGATYSEVADWLNGQNIQPGRYCRRDKWDCSMVSRLVHNKLLKGVRTHNRRITKRLNKTGRHLSVKAPPEILRTRAVPHLAFFEPVYYDQFVREIDSRNEKYRRGKNGKVDSRTGVPRSRTTWPGQHLLCGICGRQMYWSKCGNAKTMFCSGAQTYACWNSLNVNVLPHLAKLNEAILKEIAALPNFFSLLNDQLRQQLEAAPELYRKRQRTLELRLQTLNNSLENIAAALEKAAASQTLFDRLHALETEKSDVEYQLSQVKKAPAAKVVLPTQDDLMALAQEQFQNLVTEDQEAGRAMRRLIPRMYLLPYQCCDGEGIVARMHCHIELATLLSSDLQQLGVGENLSKDLVIDIFDAPQRVMHRVEVAAQRAQGVKERDIAASLGITQPAVQYAMKLHRKMQELGIEDPYLPMTQSPQGKETKFRRHLHVRFKFKPYDGFPI
jgi:site-specific DNA recombinase